MRAALRALLLGPVDYTTEALTLFAAMTTPPTTLRKSQIDTCIRALKTAGIWTKLDLLYVLAAADSQAARLNWKNPGTNTLSPVNSPAHVADRGYTGDGSTSYLSSGVNYSALAQYQQNSGALGVWSLTDADNGGRDLGAQGNNSIFVAGRNSGNQQGRVNTTGASSDAQADSLGFYGVTRRDASNQIQFRNGAELPSAAVASAAVPASDARILIGNTSFSTRQIAMAFVGGALSTADILAFYTAANTYLASVGAV